MVIAYDLFTFTGGGASPRRAAVAVEPRGGQQAVTPSSNNSLLVAQEDHIGGVQSLLGLGRAHQHALDALFADLRDGSSGPGLNLTDAFPSPYNEARRRWAGGVTMPRPWRPRPGGSPAGPLPFALLTRL
jgi:hypothetical protein